MFNRKDKKTQFIFSFSFNLQANQFSFIQLLGPCNTGGGLVGFGHPVGATGVKQLLEIHRQMKGQCGAYQINANPEYGIAANMGGDDKTAVVSIIKNC